MPVFAEQKEAISTLQVESSIAGDAHSLKQQVVAEVPEVPEVAQPVSRVASPVPPCEEEVAAVAALSASLEETDQTVVIFDWDDTLLASSFLSSHGYRLDTIMEDKENCEFVRSELKLLEQCVVTIITEALKRGIVNIITNAETGWVELSAQKFMPGIVPLLSKVNVISARSTFEYMYPDSPYKWKYCAMQEKLARVFAMEKAKKNIISFGDSHVEREAVRTVTRGVSNTRTKSIKFAECPSTEQLRKQLELVTNCFNYIFSHDGDLDLMLKMSMVASA